MKNLELLHHANYVIGINDEDTKYLITRTNNTIFIRTKYEIIAFDSVTTKSEIICKVKSEIISAEHLDLRNEICMALESGEVMLYNLHTKSYEEVSFCEGGIETMSWSPDQEVVIFVTKAKSMVVMTSTFDPICESNVDDTSAFGDGEFVTIGWGKKETQFHGSEGKQAAKQTSDFLAPADINELSQNINVSWRGDSEWFAISFVGINGRMFKTYNKEGVLQFTSEKHNNLGDCLAWRPSGNWIAVPHKLPNKYTVALFEKNGLRHREIVMPFESKDETIVGLAWSSDSDILSIETSRHKNRAIYLYTMSNYHWYLKQFLEFGEPVLSLKWDLRFNESKTFHIVSQKGVLDIYRWTYTTTNSAGDSLNNQSVVAVIDGKNGLFTDFRNKVVPPPMSSCVFEFSTFIHKICFLQNPANLEESNQFCVLGSNNLISFYELNFEQNLNVNNLMGIQFKSHKKVNAVNIGQTSHFLWMSKRFIIYCKTNDNTTVISLAEIGDIDTLDPCSQAVINGIISSICAINGNEVIVSLTNGEVHKLIINDLSLNYVGIWYDQGECSEQIAAVEINNELKLITLTINSNLYINQSKIASDVTSFFVTGKFVAFTEHNCLKFYNMICEQIVDQRKLENGAKLILIVPCDSRTVLQMPRGNLEVINPHALSLEIIGNMLDSGMYSKAMDLLRKQRINLNILFDHNPKQFMLNLDEFLNQISNCQWLNLFLSDLKNEDFTRGMYACNYIQKVIEYPENYSIDHKIQFVCENICKKMEEKDSQYFLLPIITTHVKIGNLEKALSIIWSVKKNEIQRQDDVTLKLKSEEALKYILYLVDVNELYNVALGLYDFGLVLFVANKSQKDPKEYIKFLNELKQYEENYRKYKIDVYLKRYDKALFSIAKCCKETDRFEEALEFITEHKIYQKALTAFEHDVNCYKKVSLLYADYLRTQGKFENASIMYERAGLVAQAILSAKHVLDWQRCLALTSVLHPQNAEQLEKIALSLVPALEQSGKYEEASYLLTTFTNNYEDAISCLIRGRLFLKALLEAKLKRTELIGSRIVPELLEYGQIVLTHINTDSEMFRKHKLRLLHVRKMKQNKNSEQTYEDDVDECDLISDTTSMNSSKYTGSSKGTGKTFRSSKNRRKHERKLLSLKEGNPFEDIALIDALYNHITKITNQQQHIRDTCKALMDITNDDLARKIQQSFAALLAFVKHSLDEIWIVEMQSAQAQIVGPNIDYAQYQNEQHYAMISPLKRFKPQLNIIDWQHDILR